MKRSAQKKIFAIDGLGHSTIHTHMMMVYTCTVAMLHFDAMLFINQTAFRPSVFPIQFIAEP